VKVVAEEVGAVETTVSIEYTEVCDFFPFDAVLWFGDVKDDGNSVFVVLANRSLVGRSSIGFNESARFFRVFSFLEICDVG
jgi:hypothetical protein